MPRSVNNVASKKRKKKILKFAKGFFGRRKMYGEQLKTLLKKHFCIHIIIEKQKREI